MCCVGRYESLGVCICVLLYIYWYVIIYVYRLPVLVGRWACVGSVELRMCVCLYVFGCVLYSGQGRYRCVAVRVCVSVRVSPFIRDEIHT